MMEYKEYMENKEQNDAALKRMIEERTERLLDKSDKLMDRIAETLAEDDVFSKEEILEYNNLRVLKENPEFIEGYEALKERESGEQRRNPSFKGWSMYDSTIKSKKDLAVREAVAGNEIAAENALKAAKELEKKKEAEEQAKKEAEERKRAAEKAAK